MKTTICTLNEFCCRIIFLYKHKNKWYGKNLAVLNGRAVDTEVSVEADGPSAEQDTVPVCWRRRQVGTQQTRAVVLNSAAVSALGEGSDVDGRETDDADNLTNRHSDQIVFGFWCGALCVFVCVSVRPSVSLPAYLSVSPPPPPPSLSPSGRHWLCYWCVK